MEEALRRATNPDEFKLKLQGIESTADGSRAEMENTLSTGSERPHAAAPFELSRAKFGKN